MKDTNVADDVTRAAVRLFAAQGYANTSVQQIVEAAGVTKGAMYHYFESKDDLLFAIYERMLSLQKSHLDEIIARGGPVDDVLRAVCVDVVETSIEFLAEGTVFFRSQHMLTQPRQQEVVRRRREYHDEFADAHPARPGRGPLPHRHPARRAHRELLQRHPLSVALVRPRRPGGQDARRRAAHRSLPHRNQESGCLRRTTSPETMRAWRVTRLGEPVDALVARRRAGADARAGRGAGAGRRGRGELPRRAAVRAASTRCGPSCRSCPGIELVGDVVALGDGVTGFAPGDRVVGSKIGVLSEYAVLPASDVWAAPAALDRCRGRRPHHRVPDGVVRAAPPRGPAAGRVAARARRRGRRRPRRRAARVWRPARA